VNVGRELRPCPALPVPTRGVALSRARAETTRGDGALGGLPDPADGGVVGTRVGCLSIWFVPGRQALAAVRGREGDCGGSACCCAAVCGRFVKPTAARPRFLPTPGVDNRECDLLGRTGSGGGGSGIPSPWDPTLPATSSELNGHVQVRKRKIGSLEGGGRALGRNGLRPCGRYFGGMFTGGERLLCVLALSVTDSCAIAAGRFPSILQAVAKTLHGGRRRPRSKKDRDEAEPVSVLICYRGRRMPE